MTILGPCVSLPAKRFYAGEIAPLYRAYLLHTLVYLFSMSLGGRLGLLTAIVYKYKTTVMRNVVWKSLCISAFLHLVFVGVGFFVCRFGFVSSVSPVLVGRNPFSVSIRFLERKSSLSTATSTSSTSNVERVRESAIREPGVSFSQHVVEPVSVPFHSASKAVAFSGDSELSASCLDSMHSGIESQLEYPVSLRRRRIQGEVTLRIHLGVGGSVQGVDVQRGSGRVELDELAVAAARRLPSLSCLAAEIGKGRLSVSLPIAFQLD